MRGDPAQFEAIGNRLGFQIVEASPEQLQLVWHGPRFPAYLCLAISLLLLFLSVPILWALQTRGFSGPAASLWYFPLMNLILLGIGVYLIFQRRRIVFDNNAGQVRLYKRGMLRSPALSADYREIEKLRLGIDQVYSGFAVAGSSATQRFPVPSLRLLLKGGDTVLLDRGSVKRLKDLGENIARRVHKPFAVEVSAPR